VQATDRREKRQDTQLLRPPDLLTMCRIPLAVVFLLVDSAVVRLVVLVLVVVTDIGDGIWARRIGGSKTGAVLDPVADKLFMLAAFIVVFRTGVLSPWEVLGVLLRDITALFSFVGATLLGRPTTLPARAGGKAVTVCQGLTLLAFVAESELLRPLAWATAAISLYAIWDYVNVARHRQ
jgi:CDP-diacylglycerol--glycerol-3-phosphate 3-phosphatidyltransferase/cardiolipin synthase